MAQNSGTNSGTTAQSSTSRIDPHDTLDPGESIVPEAVVRVMESIISVPNGSENTQSKAESDTEFDVAIGTVIVVALILVALIRIIIAFFPIVMSIGFITLLFMFL